MDERTKLPNFGPVPAEFTVFGVFRSLAKSGGVAADTVDGMLLAEAMVRGMTATN